MEGKEQWEQECRSCSSLTMGSSALRGALVGKDETAKQNESPFHHPTICWPWRSSQYSLVQSGLGEWETGTEKQTCSDQRMNPWQSQESGPGSLTHAHIHTLSHTSVSFQNNKPTFAWGGRCTTGPSSKSQLWIIREETEHPSAGAMPAWVHHPIVFRRQKEMLGCEGGWEGLESWEEETKGWWNRSQDQQLKITYQ